MEIKNLEALDFFQYSKTSELDEVLTDFVYKHELGSKLFLEFIEQHPAYEKWRSNQQVA